MAIALILMLAASPQEDPDRDKLKKFEKSFEKQDGKKGDDSKPAEDESKSKASSAADATGSAAKSVLGVSAGRRRWAQELGIPLTASLTGFGIIVDAVFNDPEPTWDLYILGWSLGNPAMPTFYESFFHSRHLVETTRMTVNLEHCVVVPVGLLE